MFSPSKWKWPIHDDVRDLMVSDHDVTILEKLNELCVTFYGPTATPYRQGVWDVRVELSEQYPCEPPTVRFINKVYHPNIGLESGTVCKNALKQAWKVSYGLRDLFDRLLPQLLAHPVPITPLNPEAALLSTRCPQEYDEKVRQYVATFATPGKLEEQGNAFLSDDSLASSLSDEDYGAPMPSCPQPAQERNRARQIPGFLSPASSDSISSPSQGGGD